MVKITVSKLIVDHILRLQALMFKVRINLEVRSLVHDKSKFSFVEYEIYEKYHEELAKNPYGSKEYDEVKLLMKPALDHHYAHNSHHPEHYPNGIKGMSLLDIIEMLCHWKSAAIQNKDNSLALSIEINQERFGYNDELKQILINTAKELDIYENAR